MRVFPFPRPRLLPITSAVLATLLVFKSVDLVRAVLPGASADGTSSLVVPAEAAPVEAGMKSGVKPTGKPGGAAVGITNPAAAPGSAPDSKAQDAPISDSERALLQDLRARRIELDEKAQAIAAREQVLAAAEQKLAARADELTSLQTRLEQLDTARKQRNEANWQGLVKLYENMKPRDAATIFNDLDTAVLLQVLDRMKELKAAPILAAMQPDRAREATIKLAQMRTRENTIGGS